MILGEHFPDEYQQHHINKEFQKFKVLYLYCDFTNPPKDKFLAYLGEFSEPWFFIINSKISTYIQKQKDLLNTQVELKKAEHPFLKYDSYLNCSELIKNLRKTDIEKQLSDDLKRIKSLLSQNAIAQTLSAIKFARTLARKDKELLINHLQ